MRDGARGATIRDVADAAGVSPATVSHTFSGRRPIAAPTRERVLAAARALGYIPNAHARKLRLGRSGMIGLALRPRSVRERGADVAETFNRLAGSTATEALRRGLALVHVPDLEEDGANLVPMDGCIIAHPVRGDRTAGLMEAAGMPFVLIDPEPSRPELTWVVGADYAGGIRAALASAAGGAGDEEPRPVVLLPGAEENAWNLAARAEHAEHCERAGHEAIVLELGEDLSPPAARAVVEAALERLSGPGALAYSTSDSTEAVLEAVRARGLRVPQDVRLVALTDTVHTRTAQPAVTALDLAHERVAAAAVELLLRRIEGGPAPEAPILVEPTLTLRASTAR